MDADTAPIARADVDALPPGSYGPATGNAITGAGTVTGATGADLVGAAPASITALQGAGGPAAQSATGFQAPGQYGVLSMDAAGNFEYVRNGGTPDGVRDVFNYTLADSAGATSSTTLTIDIGPAMAAALQEGVVTLPPGVELSDIRVSGRDLIVTMPDGSQMVIPGGAVFVPQLVIGDVEVPPANVAALLIDSEPQPAAGPPQSSGGNFAADVPPLDPGVPLGDLLPPTEFGYTPPTFDEVFDVIDDEPEIVVIPDGQPAAVNAVDQVDESGLPERPGEPEGTEEPQDIETTSGVISIDADDGIDSVTINGVEVTEVGQIIEGLRGNLEITSINLATGQIGYTYTVTDNTEEGVDDFEDFSIVVTDDDGDTDTATLHIDILDDAPIARDDTDSVTIDNPVAVGNVMTASGTTNSPAGVDEVGADDATLTAVQGVGPADTTFDLDGNLVVQGQFGTLTIDAEGNYTYERDVENLGGGNDVFTYTLTDGDGSTDTATLTITVPATPNDTPEILSVDNTLVDEDGLEGANLDGTPLRDGETDSTESATDTGQIVVDYKGDVPANLMTAITLVDSAALDTELQTTVGDGEPITFSLEGGQLIGRANGVGDPIVVISITGAVAGPGGQVTYTYEVELFAPVEHAQPGEEDSIVLDNVGFQVTDSNGDTASGSFDVTIVDDLPVAVIPPDNPQTPGPDPLVGGAVDEDDLENGNSDVAAGDDLADPSPTTVGGVAGSLAALFSAGADSPIQNFTLVDNPAGLPALTSNGAAVQYDIDVLAGTVTAVADTDGNGTVEADETIFVLTVNPDGSWSFELLGQLDHPEGDSENNLDLDFSSIVSAEDADGDPVTAAEGAFVINVDDDIPTANEPEPDPEHPNDPPPPLLGGRVDEDDLNPENGDNSTGNDDHLDGDEEPIDASGDSDATTTGGGEGSLDVLFNPGADRPLTYSIGDSDAAIAALEAQSLSSNGHALLYAVNDSNTQLTAYADLNNNGEIDVGEATAGNTVFTLTVNANGSWLFNLQDQIDHSVPGTEDNVLIDLGSVVIATDADGDSVPAAPGAFVIDVDDDMPKAWDDPRNPDDGCPDDVIAVNEVGTHVIGGLNLPPVGADDPGTVSFGVTNGEKVLDTEGNPVTSGGQELFYFINGDVLEARVGGEGGAPVFTITLNEDGTTYTYDQLGPITSETELNITDLSSVGGGNVEAKVIDVENSPFDIVLTTQVGETVNTNANEIGIGDGNSFQAGEILRVDLVQNSSESGGVLNFGEYYTANSYRQDVSGLGGAQTASFTVRAIAAVEAPASDPGDPADGDLAFFGDGNDTVVTTTSIKIYDDAGLEVTDLGAAGITVTHLGGGVWQIEGLPNDYDFEINSTTPFNAVQIEAIEGTDTFKLGFIDITAVVQDDVALEVPVVYTDADGDPVTCDIDIILGPPGNTPDVSILVDEAALDDVGSNPGSDAETQGGNLNDVVSGGTPPYSFELIGPNADGSSPYGTLTLDPVTGEYSFTLTAPVDGTEANNGTNVVNGVVTYTYRMTDDNGVTSTGEISINVRDDVPTAKDDTDAIVEGEASQSGNVMSGDGTTNDPAGDDIEGADGATVTAASGFGGAGTVGVGGAITVVGEFGTLVIQPNGAYVYTLSEAGAAALEELGANQTLDPEVFNYTLTDGDGDQEGATLTISLTGTNDNPGVLVPDTGDNLKVVDEDALPTRNGGEPAGTDEAADGNSSNNNDPTETVTGSFTFTAGDGATTITIQGSGAPIAVPLAGPFTPIVGDYGTLTITSIVGNTVNYSYTLADNIDHSDGLADRDDFVIVVDDSDGSNADAASDTLSIHITDDAPIADPDTDVIDEGDLTETGNVISGVGTTSGAAGDDRVGADDAEITAVTGPGATSKDGADFIVVGQWGSLRISPDGEYTYTLSEAGTAALNALGAGQTLTPEVFTYTLTDSDDSFDTATLTITPTGANDNPGLLVPDTGNDEKRVDETGLDVRTGELAGTGEAANPAPNTDNSEIETGSFTFTAGDGATVITIQGSGGPVAVPIGGPYTPIAGTYGTLTITSIVGNTVNYTYTLTDNADHSDATPDQDNFLIRVDDSDLTAADAVSDVLTIHIDDDEPLDFQPEDAIAENTGADVVTGKLDDDLTLANDGGADSIASLEWNVTDGTNLMTTDAIPVAVTAGGQQVKLYVDDVTGDLIATTDITDPEATVFTATLDAATSGYEITFLRALDNGSTSASDFTGAPAGNQDWIGIDPDLVNGAALDIEDTDDPNTESVDLLITGFLHTGRVPTTVNRDSDDIGAGQGQANDPDETLRIDFVQDLTRDDGPPAQDEQDPGGYNFDTHVGQKVFTFTMVDPKAGGDTAVLLEAYNVINEATSKSNVSTLANNDQVDIDPASVVVKLGNTVLSPTVIPDGNGGVYVSPIPAGATITFEAVGGASFEAVEITNAAGHDIPGEPGEEFVGADFAIGGFSYGQNDPGDPVEFELPVLLTDGDGDTSEGAIDVTVYPVGQVPAPLALGAETSSLSFESSSLSMLSTHDSHSKTAHQRSNEPANNNVLLGAVAAAGLGSAPLAAAEDSGPDAEDASLQTASRGERGANRDGRSDERGSDRQRGEEDDANDGGDRESQSNGRRSDDQQADQALTESSDAPADAPAQFAADTEMPAAETQTAFTSESIMMPPPEMLEASVEGGEGKSVEGDGGEGQHNAVVGKVLVDALNGGDGPDLDTLIQTLPGAGPKGLEALASRGNGDVSNGDISVFAGFTADQHPLMDQLAMHQDAAPLNG